MLSSVPHHYFIVFIMRVSKLWGNGSGKSDEAKESNNF
jgi:hypothetical protein